MTPAQSNANIPTTESHSPTLLRRRSQPNPWYERCAEKLASIATLSDNWDSYGSRKPSSLALNYAHAFLHYLRNGVNIPEPAISPNAVGNICFEWDDEIRTLTTEIDDGGRHHYYYCYRDGQDVESETLDSKLIHRLLTKL